MVLLGRERTWHALRGSRDVLTLEEKGQFG